MRGKNTTGDLAFDPEIKRTLRAKLEAARLTQAFILEDP
jgi:hypothetical protein